MKFKGSTHPRSKRRSTQNKRKGLLASIVMVPALALGVGSVILKDELGKERINPETHCYDQQEQKQVAFFIDNSLTSMVSASQLRSLKQGMMEAYDGLDANGRISVFSTARGSDSSIVKPVYSVCRPAENASGQAAIPAPEKSSRVIEREFGFARAEYESKITQLITESKTEEKAALNSPILEQLKGISRHYKSNALAELYVFSDVIEQSYHTQFCTTKGHLPSFERFSKSAKYKRVKPSSFQGAVVHYLLVEWVALPNRNLKYCTHSEIENFWSDYFEANDASIDMVVLSYGAQKK